MSVTTIDNIFCPCPGPTGAPHGLAFSIVNNATQVFINNNPVVCVGDNFQCSDGTTSKIIFGSSKVFINGKPLANLSSTTDHGGFFQVLTNSGKFVLGS